jgi:hypothetical protein
MRDTFIFIEAVDGGSQNHILLEPSSLGASIYTVPTSIA